MITQGDDQPKKYVLLECEMAVFKHSRVSH